MSDAPFVPPPEAAFPWPAPPAEAAPLEEALRRHMEQVVTLHTAMFEKLLFQGADLPLELAELFEDAANRYLGFSETISRLYLEARGLPAPPQSGARIIPFRPAGGHRSHVEEEADARIEAVRRMAQPELGLEPRIGGAEDLAQPVEDEAHGPRVQALRES
jgi:hypothetical protein